MPTRLFQERIQKKLEGERQPWASVLEFFVNSGVSPDVLGRMNVYSVYCLTGAWADEHGDKKMSAEDMRKFMS